MADIDAVDSVEGGVENIEVHGEMQPYALHFMPNTSSSWNGREVSLLLPEGIRYHNKGMKTICKDGESIREHNYIDCASGIPVLRKVELDLITKTHLEYHTTFKLTFSLLSKDISKEEYFTLLRNREEFVNETEKGKVQVLKETESTLMTKTTLPIAEIFEKTIIDQDMVLKIQVAETPNFKRNGLSIDQLLEKIHLVPSTNS